MGNTAESGNGGGLRLQQINGNDVALNYTAAPAHNHGLGSCTPTSNYVGGRIGDIEGLPVFVPGFNAGRCNVFQVNMTNNIIANNVAGWTGGGVSMQDAIASNFINNTVISNDTTASAGVLFNTNGAPNSSNPPPGCNPQTGVGCNNIPYAIPGNQPGLPSGLVTEPISILLRTLNNATGGTAFGTCPSSSKTWAYPNCAGNSGYTNPVLDNNLFWQNRPFKIAVPTPGVVSANTQTQSFVSITPTVVQATTGACGSGASYWDIGVLGDTSPTTHVAGTLNPMYSILSSGNYLGNGNQFPSPGTPGSGSGVVHQYCNGSRVPPEIAPMVCTGTTPGANAPGCILGGAIGVPAGVPDASNSTPPFGFTPAGTVDEGNNWINLFYGPLSMFNATITAGSGSYGEPLGNYSLSAPNNGVPNTSPTYSLVPSLDFFGNKRSTDGHSATAYDIGAVEFSTNAGSSNGGASYSALPNPLNFGNVAVSSSTTLTVDINNTGDTALAVSAPAISGAAAFSITSNNCGANLAIASSCTIGVNFAPGAAAGTVGGTLTVTLGGVAQQVALTGTAWQPVTATATLSLGVVNPGATSAPGTVTLTNPAGNPTLQIGVLTFSSPDFYQAGPAGGAGGTCGSSLAAGANCTINVVFTAPNTTPASPTLVNATMNINDTAANTPQVVNLSGTY
jgi:Abnormal spindle-like microcephaly-assoc'd, ASPM-SPD-2-Hydin